MPTSIFSHKQTETAMEQEERAQAAEKAFTSAWPEGTAALRALSVIHQAVRCHMKTGSRV